MKRLLKGLLVLAMGTGLLVGFPAAAHAINSTPCGGRSDFFKVVNYDNNIRNEHCFANAGNMSVYITNVTLVCSGNNAAVADFGQGFSAFNKWQCQSYSRWTLIYIHIL